MGVWLGPMGGSKEKRPPVFTFTVGQNSYSRDDFIAQTDGLIRGVGEYHEWVTTGGVINWEFAMLTSGELLFSRVVKALDVFMVGGGGRGADGWIEDGGSQGSIAHGGKGGNGGEIKYFVGVSVSPGVGYAFTVGGPGGDTVIFVGEEREKTARGGAGEGGGSGAVGRQYSAATDAGNGHSGTLSFRGEGQRQYYPNYKYGASAGGGAAKGRNNDVGARGLGGANGAGNGGDFDDDPSATAGAANSGSGGGGGGAASEQYTEEYHSGKPGGSGIIIIRNAR